MTNQAENVAHAELVGGAATTLHGHTGGGGLVHYYAESDGLSTMTLTSWQTKLTYTVVEAGDFLVQWSYELSGDDVAFHCRSQVLHNSTPLSNVQFEPEDVSPEFWLTGAGFKKLTLAVDDTINIQYCISSSSGEAWIRYARILLIKL